MGQYLKKLFIAVERGAIAEQELVERKIALLEWLKSRFSLLRHHGCDFAGSLNAVVVGLTHPFACAFAPTEPSVRAGIVGGILVSLPVKAVYLGRWSEKRLVNALKSVTDASNNKTDPTEIARRRGELQKRETDLAKAQAMEQQAQEDDRAIQRLTVDAADANKLGSPG